MDLTSLKKSAATIRDEQTTYANTATRVGTHLMTQVEALSELDTYRQTIAPYLTYLRTTIIAQIGTYDTWALALAALDAMRPTTHPTSGRYTIIIGGVTYPVTYIIGGAGPTIWQAIEGGIIIRSDGTLATSTARYHTICSRYYEDSKWSAWQSSAKISDIPTPQTTTQGTNRNYVYSNSADSPHGILSGTFKAFQNSGRCYIRHKFWGSSNDYADGQYVTSEIPYVTTGANGVFEAAMLVRLRNTTLTEVSSTTTAVNITYPNYANGSTKTLTLTPATTAKAGIMTTAHVNDLNNCKATVSDLNNRVINLESTEASKRLAKIEADITAIKTAIGLS